jgi:hypothetical protein
MLDAPTKAGDTRSLDAPIASATPPTNPATRVMQRAVATNALMKSTSLNGVGITMLPPCNLTTELSGRTPPPLRTGERTIHCEHGAPTTIHGPLQ